MRILSSSEFIAEAYRCMMQKHHTEVLDTFFKNFLEKYGSGFGDVMKRVYDEVNKDSLYDSTYRLSQYQDMVYSVDGKRFDIFDYYGVRPKMVDTDEGTYYSFMYDSTHGFEMVPVLNERGAKYREPSDDGAPYSGYVSTSEVDFEVYALHDGKRDRLSDIDKDVHPYGDIDWVYSKNMDKWFKELAEYTDKWDVKNGLFGQKNKELYENAFKTASEYERRMSNGQCAHRVVMDGATGTLYRKGREIGTVKLSQYTVNSMFSPNMVKYLIVTSAKDALERAFGERRHPDTSDMTNLEKEITKTVYTERNLPKDHYTLYDYYRTYAGEYCEHCGKDPIVNVMIIENPKGERFHVGNECVKHLVDIPESEFENVWNAPFREATNIMNKYRKDKASGREQQWFTYNGKCYYLSSVKPILDYALFNRYEFDERRGFVASSEKPEKVLKRDITVNVYEEEFVKKMLPKYYAGSILVDTDIEVIVGFIQSVKSQSNPRVFELGPIEFTVPMSNEIKYPYRFYDTVEIADKTIGDYSQKFRTVKYDMIEPTYTFGDTSIEFKYDRLGR